MIKQCASNILSAKRSALVMSTPSPGMAEQWEADVAQHLIDKKAAMTSEEIKALVAETKDFRQWNSNYMTNDDFTITPADLPDPLPAAPISINYANGLTLLSATADVNNIGEYQLLFNTDSVQGEDLHYLTLYSTLLATLPTATHTTEELNDIIHRSFSALRFNASYQRSTNPTYDHPVFTAAWIGPNDMQQRNLETIMELLSTTDFTQTDKILQHINEILPYYRPGNQDSLTLASQMTLAALNPSDAYGFHLIGPAFYEFLSDIVTKAQENPAYMTTITEKLQAIQEQIIQKDELIITVATSAEAMPAIKETLLARLNKLPAKQTTAYTYETLPAIAKRTAIITNDAYQNIFIRNNLPDQSATSHYAPFITAVSDKVLIPTLRFQNGAYGADAHLEINYHIFSTYTSNDPQLAQSIDTLSSMSEQLKNLSLSDTELDNYILYTYGQYTSPQGPLTHATDSFTWHLKGVNTGTLTENISAIRDTTMADLAATIESFETISDDAVLVVTGSQSAIENNKDLFDEIVDYR